MNDLNNNSNPTNDGRLNANVNSGNSMKNKVSQETNYEERLKNIEKYSKQSRDMIRTLMIVIVCLMLARIILYGSIV